MKSALAILLYRALGHVKQGAAFLQCWCCPMLAAEELAAGYTRIISNLEPTADMQHLPIMGTVEGRFQIKYGKDEQGKRVLRVDRHEDGGAN